ncbi:hypothetical protein CBR_g50658 [Chara braunii]|uniref:Uncharacterized protein n=1 Tax=Chara braunii TaxID=69332 RepID=A0A388M754_CHABU|nr:hypothetical protein CBR_g50658 [Chara braunii]|eukprot:GBG90411.1 hypothetical protein CBR_g50658 [Chara braunii]
MEGGGQRAKMDGEAALDDPALLQAIEKLQEVQDELDRVNEEATDKVLEVEQKYTEIRRPVYKKRSEIISQIPDFWQTAFLTHPALSQELTVEDRKVFKYLNQLEVEVLEDVKAGYDICFTFKPNPYFEDAKLVKSYRFVDGGAVKVSGTAPKWKEGMDLTANGASAQAGAKRKHVPTSFFQWFLDDHREDDEDLDDEIAESIKDELWPYPLKYFNQNSEDDAGDCEEGDDEDEEEGDSEEEGQEGDGNGVFEEDEDEEDEDEDEAE